MSEDLERISSIMKHGSCYPVEKFVRLGLTLLNFLEIDKEIYKNKNLECFKTGKLKDAPLIGLLLCWSGYCYEKYGTTDCDINVVKTNDDWVVIKVKWSDSKIHEEYTNILLYVDEQKKLKYIQTTDCVEHLLEVAKKAKQKLPGDCEKALSYYWKNGKWDS